MAKIKYCPKCGSGSRQHLLEYHLCKKCSSQLEDVQIPRSKYFLFMMPFLFAGFIAHAYAVVYWFSTKDSPNANTASYRLFGLLILGVGLYIIAIGLQILDSKYMEKEAERVMAEKKKESRSRHHRHHSHIERRDSKGIPIRKPRDRGRDSEELEEEEKKILPKITEKLMLPARSEINDEDEDEEEIDEEPKKSIPVRGPKKDEDEEPPKIKGKKSKKSKSSKGSKKDEPPKRPSKKSPPKKPHEPKGHTNLKDRSSKKQPPRKIRTR